MGIIDVEAWMMTTSARVLDFWQAYDRIEPIGDQWLQTASICQLLSQGHGYQLAANGVKHEPSMFTRFMPGQWRRPKWARNGGDSNGGKKSVSMNVLRIRLEERFKAK